MNILQLAQAACLLFLTTLLFAWGTARLLVWLRDRGFAVNESKALYIAIAFMQQCVSLVWVQALYNDPSIWKSRSTEEWVIIGIISGANVLTGTLVTWKAAASTSSSTKNGKPHETTPPPGPVTPPG